MKISTKGRYGLRIMLDLARNSGNTPRMVSDICAEQNLSTKYVGRLILKLRSCGMIESVRGAKGGYIIRRLPKHITLLEIIEIMEGDISLVACVGCPKKCKNSGNCIPREIWRELNEKIRHTFQSITLQDVLDRGYDGCDFCI